MLTKPQVFYDDTHKQALGYQNPFYLKKAQRIKPTLYDGSVISSQHVASLVFDDEETLILEELQTLHPNTDQSASSPVKIEAPQELPKMEAAVQQYFVDKQSFEIQKKGFFLENDRLLQKIMSQDVMICVMNSTALCDDVNMEMRSSKSYVKCLDLDTELLNKQNAYNDLSKNQFDSIKKTLTISKEHDDSLIAQLNSKSMENADLKRQIQDKVFVITSLKNDLRKLKGKEVKNASQISIATTVAPGLKYSTSTCRSQPTGNKKNDKISQKPSSNRKNKVEAQPRKVNKKNHVKEPICDGNVKHTMLNANSQLICVKCKVFTDVGLKWKPTRRLFTIVGNSCPLTRITPKKITHLKETTSNSVETPNQRLKSIVVQIVLWYLDSGCSKHMTGNRSQLMNFVSKFMGTVRFKNDQIAKIMRNVELTIDAYRFKIDKKKCRFNTEVFREILHICPRLHNQDFIVPPSEDELIPFIQELGYSGKKTTGLDRLRESQAQILWGMYNLKNVDYVALLWEEFMYQANNRDIICNDFLLGTLKFVSKTEYYQKYRAVIPDGMINQDIKASKAYNTYHDFATRKVAPKKQGSSRKLLHP
ncbi:hypothetical protein Tco_0475587 [Tanacetum coccineum]